MTIKLHDAVDTHSELCGPLLTLFMKKPELTFVEANTTYNNKSEKVANIFNVYHNLDEVGRIGYRSGKLFVESKRIRRERRPINEFRTMNPKALIRKSLEVFIPLEVDNVVEKIMSDTRSAVEAVRYGVYRKLPDISARDALVFFCDYKTSDTRVPIPADIDVKLTDTAIKNMQDYKVVIEMQNLVNSNQGYALREEINNNITVVSLKDKSIMYRGSSTYDLPEWMQSKVTILKLLEKNQAARNIGCKGVEYDSVFYYIVDGEIPDLIE
jgi:hypothetical protein